MDLPATPESRTQPRRLVGLIVIVAATAQSLGTALRMPTQLTANDISRYCTVWSLLERGTYAIDDCPWQKDTQDKVKKPAPFSREATPPEHFYSSKPPLFATAMAGVIYPFRALTGVPLDATVPQPRVTRNVEKEVAGRREFVAETPPPALWPAYVLYFKPAIVLFNVVPFAFFLVAYARLLDRYAANDWSWFLALFSGAFGTFLIVFNSTLNNHSVAAYAAFFALDALARIVDDEGPARPRLYAAAGFFGAGCACNELPAALFGVLLFAILVAKNPRATLGYFAPAAALPIAAFLVTQYLAFGQFRPVYEEFGTRSYTYEGSYWNTPLEFDYFNLHPESTALYLFHMTLGHHGVFSLTPIFAFSIYGCLRNLADRARPLRAISGLTLALTVAMIAFYAWNPKARNYGGSTQGLRWLFWLIPAWLIVLPTGLEPGQDHKWPRRLALAALAVSMLTVGYALRSPWTNPWVTDLLEHLNIYPLVR